MPELPRVITPKGEILKLIIIKPRSSPEIAKVLQNIAKPTVYRGIKDLLIAGWVKSTLKENLEIYEATKEGVRTFWSSIFNDELAGRLVRVGEEFGVSTYDLVELGVRLVLDVLEYGVLSDEVRRVIERYDPALAEQLRVLVAREEVMEL